MSTATFSGKVVWFTGLSGAGKSTLCLEMNLRLRSLGYESHVIDADIVRNGLCSDLGYSYEDRLENIRRIAHIANLFSTDSHYILVAAISPYRSSRQLARSIIPNMLEVFVDAPLSVCEARDPKGLYRRARAGTLKNFTGIDSPFETPSSPDMICRTDRQSVDDSANQILVKLGLRDA